MKLEEKLLALELVLRDIRTYWGEDLEERVDVAEQLAKDIREYNEYENDMQTMLYSIQDFRESMENNWHDGRHFREEYPEGYEGMGSLHNLTYTYNDKSDSFKKVINCLTYPEYCFEDWNKKA